MSTAPNAHYVGTSVASAFWHYYPARISDSVRRKSRRSKRITNTTGKLTAACNHVPDIDMSQVRVIDDSDWSKSVAAGVSQWAAVGCAVAGVLLFRLRGRALRPGVGPGCTPTIVGLVRGHRDNFPNYWEHLERSRCDTTVTFLSSGALQCVVGAAVGAPEAQRYSIRG